MKSDRLSAPEGDLQKNILPNTMQKYIFSVANQSRNLSKNIKLLSKLIVTAILFYYRIEIQYASKYTVLKLAYLERTYAFVDGA
jgi:hypothetical protein